MKDSHSPEDRQEMAAQLREIRACTDFGESSAYRRAFCLTVLANYRTGLAVVPRKDAEGRWYPRATR